MPTSLGRVVNDLLVEQFPGVVDIGFTSQMEEELDDIAEYSEPYKRPDPYAPLWKRLTAKPRPSFEFDGIAWGALGAAMDCYESARRYAAERIQFGKPIASFQLQQKKLAEMITEITKAQLLAWRLGVLKNENRATPGQISMAKRNNVRVGLETARLARDLMGANGITLEYPVFRHMCNLESVYTYEGTDHIHTLILGEHITGLPAYK